MLLSELFEKSPDIEIKQLSIDSRLPMKDCIFFCLNGIKYNGHDYVLEAIKNGATVIVYENDIDIKLNAIFIKVDNVANCLNTVAAKFYGYPANDLETYLISGCDGKSSVNHIMYNLINKYKACASIGSFGIFYQSHHLSTSTSTLTILDNQKYLNEFKNNNIKAALFEADALSISYKKVDAINPDVFIYTSTNELSSAYKEIGVNYYDVLCNYLYTIEKNVKVILNHDDLSFGELVNVCEDVYSYGFNEESDYLINNVLIKKDVTYFSLMHDGVNYPFKMSLIGINNVYNAACALAALDQMGYPLNELIIHLENIKQIDGVLERIDNNDFNIYVDCAHNLNNLKYIYDFASSIKKDKKIYVVYGINSSDDKETIKEISELSKKYVDHMILTENNTYGGDIEKMINEIEKYFDGLKLIFVEDRSLAIEAAIELLNKDDLLFILGKGNQTTITRSLGKQSYEGDKKIAINCLNKRIKEENDCF